MASEAQQISQTSASVADQKITRRHWWTVVTVSMLVSTAAVLIGTYKFQLGPAPVVLFPIIWAVVIGGIIGTQ
ncbi:MAG: hypothetical protein ABIP92_07135, partial [Arthrobacter sp.]